MKGAWVCVYLKQKEHKYIYVYVKRSRNKIEKKITRAQSFRVTWLCCGHASGIVTGENTWVEREPKQNNTGKRQHIIYIYKLLSIRAKDSLSDNYRLWRGVLYANRLSSRLVAVNNCFLEGWKLWIWIVDCVAQLHLVTVILI